MLMIFTQLAYEPLVTPLVAQMRSLAARASPQSPQLSSSPSSNGNGINATNWVVVDGLEVVAEMAIEAFELMTGRMAPKRLMKEVCWKGWEAQQLERRMQRQQT